MTKLVLSGKSKIIPIDPKTGKAEYQEPRPQHEAITACRMYVDNPTDLNRRRLIKALTALEDSPTA